ncbi:MAG: hypothetical protein M1827_002559 [Pycnora praestabilis]|nr:MAG: hypothetical protein M1827_002559 [Pycnora praestabilis]
MSTEQPARNRSISLGSGHSRPAAAQERRPIVDAGSMFEPCDATASMLLYSQGTSILCLHHDTLAIERRFQRHTEQILLLSVDNVSDRGAGRHVVSYDSGQTAIVWDIFTGDEIARFSSYENIKVASWMKNGNIAFGNSQGNVILFEPSTSEHLSARTIYDPITALAPATDCRTYAIGYQNGSILIATLQPSFTILHTLTTSRGPSPIVTLAWHASSSRQKSEMLATQTLNGDIRVWSIAKAPTNEAPRVVRVLKRSDNREPGQNWLAWSKNGRIIQYSEGETWAWDVRTKHVTYEPVPTLDAVIGLAMCGPSATLFTLGRNHTIQQFDLNPPTLVANVQHLPIIPPPSPPVSIEEQKQQDAAAAAAAANAMAFVSDSQGSESEGENKSMSSLQKIANEMNQIEEKRQERSGGYSGIASPSRSRTASISSMSSGGHYQRSNTSIYSRSTAKSSNGTLFSDGSSSMPSGWEGMSIGYSSSPSLASSQRSRPGRGSRLKQEVLRSPEQVTGGVDLFVYTKARLSDVPYQHPQAYDQSHLTADNLRKQMLSVVFGWEDDIESLIRDECELRPPQQKLSQVPAHIKTVSRHASGSASAVLLSKWLGEVDADMMTSMLGSETMSSSDWMMLALSQIGGEASTKKIGQAFVQRLLAKDEVHAAATILLGLGEQNDAVEVYVSRGYLMEAVLLTCLVFPADWQRQSHLVRKWGEIAVQSSKQELAIRCFSCTGIQPSEVFTSPRAAMFEQHMQSMPSIISPPMSPPSVGSSSRITAKTSALKLITSFGAKGTGSDSQSNYMNQSADERTPRYAAGVTPIADSAMSPGGMATMLRPNTRGAMNPSSARTATPGGYTRQRLPSIGEAAMDDTPRPVKQPITAVHSGPMKDRENINTSPKHERRSSQHETEPVLLLSAAKYEPSSNSAKLAPTMKHELSREATKSPMSQLRSPTLPSPAQGAFSTLKQESRSRNGSRNRKPDDLQIQWPPMESIITGDYMSSASESSSGLNKHRRSSTASSLPSTSSMGGRSDVRSPPLTGESIQTLQDPPMTGRSIDRYISSLEEANYHSRSRAGSSRHRKASREGRAIHNSDEEANARGRSRPRLRDLSSDRGRYVKPAKRSPSSPVPMSPEDIDHFNQSDNWDDERYYEVSSSGANPKLARDHSNMRFANPKSRAESKVSEYSTRTVRRASLERRPGSRAGSKLRSKPGSRVTSRRQSPETGQYHDGRGRSQAREEGSSIRSPSSPLPMSTQVKYYKRAEEGDDAELQDLEEDRKRLRSQQRSTSRRPQERGSSALRDRSPEHRRQRDRSESRRPRERGESSRRQPSVEPRQRRDLSETRPESRGLAEHKPKLSRMKMEQALKKEMAAKELEDRRKSLAQRPSAPAIPHPGELSGGRPPFDNRSRTEMGNTPTSKSPMSDWGSMPSRSKTVSPEAMMNYHSGVSGTNTASVTIGLPATPRAMRHPKYMSTDPNERDNIPAVPEIPEYIESLAPLSSQDEGEEDKLAPLPGVTYTAQYRHQGPPRSASAPVFEKSSSGGVHSRAPAASLTQHSFLPPNTRRRNPTAGLDLAQARVLAVGKSLPGTSGYATMPAPVMFSIDETIQASSQAINPENDDQVPPPPPPPPILPQLQHLAGSAQPPPPPLPPSVFKPGHAHTNSGGSGSGIGVINIGIEGQSRGPTPVVEVPPPPPSHSSNGHRRGRSVNENLSTRIRGMTDRMRSTSRGRNTRSPPVEHYRGPAPYESVPPLRSDQLVRGLTPDMYSGSRKPGEYQARMTGDQLQTGYVPMEGGMI